MTRSANPRPATVGISDLTATLEAIAVRIGDKIGESIAQALTSFPEEDLAPQKSATRNSRADGRVCMQDSCGRPVAAKGLCKSHYNLMLYHRRKGASFRKGKRQP